MALKGAAALRCLRREHEFVGGTPHLQAVFQREVVKAYNGGTEFVWRRDQWMISPNMNPPYPNHVLHTQIDYDLPRPIAFDQAAPILE